MEGKSTNEKLSESDSQIVISFIVKRIESQTQHEILDTIKDIQLAQHKAFSMGKRDLESALSNVIHLQPNIPNIPSFRLREKTRRTRIGFVFPYTHKSFEETIDQSYFHEYLRTLFPHKQMSTVTTESGLSIPVDDTQTARELAQIIPAIRWCITMSGVLEGGPSFRDLSNEFSYRVYKYHRLVDPIEDKIVGKTTSDTDEIRSIAEDLIHDGKRGVVSKGKLTNFKYELSEEFNDLLEKAHADTQKSPLYICPEMTSLMAADLSCRLLHFDRQERPLLATLALLMMSDVFKVVPPVDTRYFEHAYQIEYEERYLLTLGKALIDGYEMKMELHDVVETVGGLISMELDIGKERLVSMTETALGLKPYMTSFNNLNDIQDQYRREVQEQQEADG
jgi:hypothetical protein